MVHNHRIHEVFSLFFSSLADREEPTLAHCASGEGRTGVAVALLQDILGVSWCDIQTEYCLTNKAGNREVHYDQVLPGIRKRHPNIDAVGLNALVSVDRSYLQAAFDSIRERYGSIAKYLEEVLNVDAAMRASLERRFLVSGPLSPEA